MTTTDIIQNVVNLLLILGVGFSVYKSWATPQKKNDENDIRLAERLEQVRNDLANLRDNHVHTLDIRITETNKAVQDLALQLTRLNTIIEERIPKK